MLDFTEQPDGSAIPWLKQHGFEFKLRFSALNPQFRAGKPDEAVVTDLQIDPLFYTLFKKSPTPPVSGIGIQVNTKNLEGESSAFLKNIEFLRSP